MGAQHSKSGENPFLNSEEILQFEVLLNTIDGHDRSSLCTTKHFQVESFGFTKFFCYLLRLIIMFGVDFYRVTANTR